MSGMTDVLILDGLYALSTNPAIMIPVVATIAGKEGVIIVLDMEAASPSTPLKKCVTLFKRCAIGSSTT